MLGRGCYGAGLLRGGVASEPWDAHDGLQGRVDDVPVRAVEHHQVVHLRHSEGEAPPGGCSQGGQAAAA